MFNIGLDTWKVILPSVGALLGAMIGKPAFEFFKDWMSASREWKNKRKDVVEKLRFVYGNLEAFREINKYILSQNQSRDVSQERILSYQNLLLAFDTKPLSEAIQQLTVLAPGASDKSGAAQFLTSQLLLIVLLIRSAQKEKNEATKYFTLEDLDLRMKTLDRFVEHDLAHELKFEGFSVTLNPNKRKFEKEMQASELRRAIRLTETLKSDVQKLQGKKIVDSKHQN